MDFIDGWFGTVFYTEKESNLHVTGDKGPCVPCAPSISDEIALVDKLSKFHRDGFFCTENAVPEPLICEARRYINGKYRQWLKSSKRQDDWRCHLMTDLSDPGLPVEHPALMNLLLKAPALLCCIEQLTGSGVSSIFYSQVAFRTPLSAKQVAQQLANPVPDYSPGAEYHLDGQANSSGTRFPDPWSVLVGIALVDICTEDKGNFTVFPGWHTRRDWSNYPEEKRSKTLPDLGTPKYVCLKAGDAVLAHVLLPHRGGKNSTGAPPPPTALAGKAHHHDQEGSATDTGIALDCTKAKKHAASHAVAAPHPYGGTERWEIPASTREMVFFRVRVAGVAYEDPQRGPALLADPWAEFPGLRSIASEEVSVSSPHS